MSSVKLDINNGTDFATGDAISGIAMWQLDKRPKEISINLFWYTSGKGTRDVQIADTIKLESPKDTDAHSFEFKAPAGPYSFSGTLISLKWAIELVTKDTSHRTDITISPTCQEITL
ncbi:hypothetical protein BVX97_01890 [bacterium E08(2017)]|nr:hypothetical protein BVX97_01890 [bacterium E08(2017)]